MTSGTAGSRELQMATELQEETLVQLDEFDIETGLPAFLAWC